MFTFNTKKNILIAALVVLSFSSKAFEGIKPNVFNNILELKVINNNTVQVKSNLFTLHNETFELQKSYDNNNYTSVAIIFAQNVNETFGTIELKDNIQNNNQKVTYRIVKIENDKATSIVTKSIDIR